MSKTAGKRNVAPLPTATKPWHAKMPQSPSKKQAGLAQAGESVTPLPSQPQDWASHVTRNCVASPDHAFATISRRRKAH